MPRIRYLKPEFFKDEDLKELPFEARLFYQGLWCYADKEGRGEDRPERLKVEIFPYDAIDAEAIMVMLAKPKNHSRRPFINRYEVDGNRYYEIINWHKHQKPHNTERESSIPGKEPLNNVHLPVTYQELKRKENGEGEGKGKGEGVTFPLEIVRAPETIGETKHQKNKPTEPEIKDLLDYFARAYRTKLRTSYDSMKPDKERAILKDLIEGGRAPADIKLLMDKFFTSTDDFIQSSAHTISVFKSVIPKLTKSLHKKDDPLWRSQQLRKERLAREAKEGGK